ncbi:hypothetical protein ACHQM5_000811 [Ranunculus cassubicifolius]
MEPEKRGSIAFFATYRPPVPLDLYSRHPSNDKEFRMSDGNFYNYNGRIIPDPVVRLILQRLGLPSRQRVAGMIYGSDRDNLEKLYIYLRFIEENQRVEVYSLADIYGHNAFGGVCMEDSGCFAGDNLIYVSTKEPARRRRQPWTAVYSCNILSGITNRLTPPDHADLSPAPSPSGEQIAVASFEYKEGGWDGEIEDLKTDIIVMNAEEPYNRRVVIKNGGWPTWGSENVIFFHRKDDKRDRYGNKLPEDMNGKKKNFWGVYRAEIKDYGITSNVVRVTPDTFDAMTPVAIDENRVAVATIRKTSKFGDVRGPEQYRHIEIFNINGRPGASLHITREARPLTDHFNPFLTRQEMRIGYHRSDDERPDHIQHLAKIETPYRDIGLLRTAGVFPSFTADGSKVAFVDNEFKSVWVADDQGLQNVFQVAPGGSVFAPIWNKNMEKDTLYFCVGPAFSADKEVNIYALSDDYQTETQLTFGSNNAFPSSSPDGNRLVYRSTRENGMKNLYIMENADEGEDGGITRLTYGDWTDTHCDWSPIQNDWILFSSTRDKPFDAPALDNGLDPGYFCVYLVNANNPSVVVRVLSSGYDFAGHVNHPFFSPDGRSIVVSSDLAAVSVEPISLPLFVHSVRPYGDIFTVDIDPRNIRRNQEIKTFRRITHSRYESSTATWSRFNTRTLQNMLSRTNFEANTMCPYFNNNGGETFHMTGHLVLPKRCC